MTPRPDVVAQITASLRRSRAVLLVGPRQSGKTTIARTLVPADSANYFDLEDPVSLARLSEPMTALGDLRGLVVIDELQRRPSLFSVLRVLCDRTPLPAQFLLLGSASPGLLRGTSESLAGRIEIVELCPFGLCEVGSDHLERHWLRGGFPLSYLAESDEDSDAWRRSLVRTFLERDVPEVAGGLPSETLYRLWTMLAHQHGGVWSAADPARSLGIGETTVRRYLDVLAGLFVVRQLRPWYENMAKRQVRSPKVYVRDSGLLHTLLGLRTLDDLLRHPRCGASWEGYIIEEVLKCVPYDEAYFWGTHQGAELDLLLHARGRRYGVEVKREDAPRITKSMHIALADLGLERLTVIYPGVRAYSLSEKVHVMPVRELAAQRRSLTAAG